MGTTGHQYLPGTRIQHLKAFMERSIEVYDLGVILFIRRHLDCFHTRAKFAIWMIIRIAQFESCSVHTREVIAIFELRSVHTRDRICDLAFQSRRTCVARVWVPCQSNMHGVHASCPSVHMQRAVYLSAEVVRRSRSSAPKSQFWGQGIHTAISLRNLRDA